MNTNYKSNLKFNSCPFDDETNQKFIDLLNAMLKSTDVIEVELTFEVAMKDGTLTRTQTGAERLSADLTRMLSDVEAAAEKATVKGDGKAKVKGEIMISKGL